MVEKKSQWFPAGWGRDWPRRNVLGDDNVLYFDRSWGCTDVCICQNTLTGKFKICAFNYI